MSKELKPCPFCKSDAVEYDGEPVIDCLVGTCKCSDAECMGGAIWMYIDAWNHRPIEDELQKKYDKSFQNKSMANLLIEIKQALAGQDKENK